MVKKQNKQAPEQVLDATVEMAGWMQKNWKTLAKAIAKFAIFCPPEIFLGTPKKNYTDKQQFITITQKGQKTPSFIRRAKSPEKYKTYKEENGELLYLDDNTVINNKFKSILNLNNCKNYMTCHIWAEPASPKVFSCIANIVLLPTNIAGLSDYCKEIKEILQYRAYELYNWKPEHESIPLMPAGYEELKWTSPKNFNTPRKAQSVDSRKEDITIRLERWSKKTTTIVYKTIEFVKNSNQPVNKSDLLKMLYDFSNNPGMIIASLMTETGNSYGRVLEYVDKAEKQITIKEDLKEIVNKLWK